MQLGALQSHEIEKVGSVFEHSITWEDDIWKGDPFDVAEVHGAARQKFLDLLERIGTGQRAEARILLFHGQSGAGKTHLIRALRNTSHERQLGFFGYAQMTPDVTHYADYFLRRLINSLEKPYGADKRGESGLIRLSRRLVEDSDAIDQQTLVELRETDLEPGDLARLITELADDVLTSECYCDQELDINIVRALLYLQRNDPRIDQRVRQYLYGRQLNEFSQTTVGALDPNDGEDRAFEIMESLGRLMRSTDGASLVFCIDQVEDLRFYDDAEERFKRAVRDLIQIINRVPSAIVIISCLSDFYEQVRDLLPESYRARIEKSGPVLLAEARTAAEARLIVANRLRVALGNDDLGPDDAAALFGEAFFEEVASFPTRRLLEAVQMRWREMQGEPGEATPIRVVGGRDAETGGLAELWERFALNAEFDVPSDENELSLILTMALKLAGEETGGLVRVETTPADWIEGLAAFDLGVTHAGNVFSNRLFICNKGSQGGALKRQIEKAAASSDGLEPFIIRASDFPPNAKNATAQTLRRFLANGGRRLSIPIYEWERMMTMSEFHARYRRTDGFGDWLARARILAELPSIEQLLRLDLGGPQFRPTPRIEPVPATQQVAASEPTPLHPASQTPPDISDPPAVIEVGTIGEPETANITPPSETRAESDWSGDYLANIWGGIISAIGPKCHDDGPEVAARDPDSESAGGDGVGTAVPTGDGVAGVEETAGRPSGIETVGNVGETFPVGEMIDQTGEPVALSKGILRRHAAMLGGSGSGKTTLALGVVEQLLMSGVPVVLVDRKGDLCSYANPEVWRPAEHESEHRRARREELGSMIDVAVYTPGRTSGRPISITLLPNGIAELPGHDQQQLANVSAAAISDMLHLKNSATHQRQGGILSVALKLLGSQSHREVSLADLIYMLENDDAELIDLTQRMDPSGKLRRDLIAQLDSLRHRNWALFEGGGEPLRMESLLGTGPFARPGRTRLSVIYTGFLGDNENILFWVAQFLSEALRFCQRNPNDDLQAVILFDEADLYIPANARPATSEPLQSLLKRARSAGVGIVLATQSPGDLDYKSRDQITSWFIGRVREDTALRKLKAAFGAESGLDPAHVLPNQTVGEFHLIQEASVKPIRSSMSLIRAEQVAFDRIEQLARETRGQDTKQLKLEF